MQVIEDDVQVIGHGSSTADSTVFVGDESSDQVMAHADHKGYKFADIDEFDPESADKLRAIFARAKGMPKSTLRSTRLTLASTGLRAQAPTLRSQSLPPQLSPQFRFLVVLGIWLQRPARCRHAPVDAKAISTVKGRTRL